MLQRLFFKRKADSEPASITFAVKDRGSSSIELLITGLLLILPLTYLTMSLGQIQSAVLAAEGGTRQAARLFVRADSLPAALAQSEVALKLAFENHALGGTDYQISVACQPVSSSSAARVFGAQVDCLTPGIRVTVRVDTQVLLPFVPGFIPAEFASIPIRAEANQIVSKFAGGGR